MLFAFGAQQGGSFKAIDFMLTAAMKKYLHMAILLTNDHNDFTTRLFDLIALLPLEPNQGAIVPFGLYKFSAENIQSCLACR